MSLLLRSLLPAINIHCQFASLLSADPLHRVDAKDRTEQVVDALVTLLPRASYRPRGVLDRSIFITPAASTTKQVDIVTSGRAPRAHWGGPDGPEQSPHVPYVEPAQRDRQVKHARRRVACAVRRERAPVWLLGRAGRSRDK